MNLKPQPIPGKCVRCHKNPIKIKKIYLCDSCAKYWYSKKKEKLSLEEFLLRCPARTRKEYREDEGEMATTYHKPIEFIAGFVIYSPKMQNLCEKIERVAKTNATTLIYGETGTGKEYIAQAIHEKSSRRNAPFITIDCTGLPDTLAESEFFGYEKGAFTGAYAQKKGLFEVASKGTIFLDEISELPLSFQAKLLRVLEYGVFRRVGGTHHITTDIRIIAATNKNLHELVEEKKFREDLLYRLNVVMLEVPSLRERPEDIPVLTEYFMEKFKGDTPVRLSKEAIATLRMYQWRGNIRELRNLIEQLIIFAPSEILTCKNLPLYITKNEIRKRIPLIKNNEDDSFEEVYERHFRKIHEQCWGKVADIARVLKVHQKTVRKKLRQYGLLKKRRK